MTVTLKSVPTTLRFSALTREQERRIAQAREGRAEDENTVDKVLDKFMSREQEPDLSQLPEMEKPFVKELLAAMKTQFRNPWRGPFDDKERQANNRKLEALTERLRKGAFRVPEPIIVAIEWAYGDAYELALEERLKSLTPKKPKRK